MTLARGLDDGAVARALGVLGTVGSAEGRAALARRWDPVTQRTWVIGAPPGAGSSVLEGAPAELG